MPPTGYIINDLNFLYNEFKNETAGERRDSKPIVMFASRKYSDDDLLKVSSAVRDRMFLVGNETRATLTTARMAMLGGVTYYWSTQDPYGNPASFDQIKQMGDKVYAAGKLWYAPLNPGYNSTLLGTGGRIPRKNGDTIRKLWTGNLASNPDGWAFISGNEIAENTHIKPMQKWGNTYLNVLSELIGPLHPHPRPPRQAQPYQVPHLHCYFQHQQIHHWHLRQPHKALPLSSQFLRRPMTTKTAPLSIPLAGRRSPSQMPTMVLTEKQRKTARL